VRLSKRGKRLATAMVERSRELEEEAAARLGRKEMEHLRSHLETLGSIWGEG
jgi:hypothetical protein